MGGGGGSGPRRLPTRKSKKAIGFFSNTGPDPIENHKASNPVINVGPSSAYQRNAIKMVGPLPLQKQQKPPELSWVGGGGGGPPSDTLSGSAHRLYGLYPYLSRFKPSLMFKVIHIRTFCMPTFLFGLVLYIPVDTFSVMLERVFLGRTSRNQRIK